MRSSFFSIFGFCLTTTTLSATVPAHDVVIYGGTAAGVAAAVEVARSGHTAILIEPSQHIGGLTSGGLGMTDSGDNRAIGGIAREFYQRCKKHYDQPSAWKQEKASDYAHYKANEDAIWRFEPSVAEKILREMLAEAKVSVIYGQRLDLQNGVEKMDGDITSIRMESGQTFAGKRFIDATYEGDLMAKAGVHYTVGREAASQYGETYNGVQTQYADKHQFTTAVDAYVKPGDASSGLLPGIQSAAPGADGSADARVQAYCFRLCMTDDPTNRVPWNQPEHYDPLRYELGLRYALAGNKVWMKPDFMPNRKTDTNNNGAFSMDNIGMNYAYPDGDYATREKILKEHYEYQMGLCYFLANDPRVPAAVRAEFSRFGLAKDEFTDHFHWPQQIYVREARRMIGAYVHTEADCRRLRATPASIGMGSYNMDSHNCQRYVDASGHARNEGDIQKSPGGPYPISYQCLVPQAAECQNLIVPVCLSSSHIAYGSIRMEPVFMVLGQSSAAAACLSLDHPSSVQTVSYEALRAKLLQEKQVLDLAPPAPTGINPRSLPGQIQDDTAAQKVGDWTESAATKGYVGQGYLHDSASGKGEKCAVFTLPIAKSGNYTVEIAYTALGNRSPAVPVSIATADGAKEVTVNQQQPPTHDGFAPLGKYRFTAGQAATITISNAHTQGHVIVDAVRLLPD